MKTTARFDFSRKTFVGSIRAIAISTALVMVLAIGAPTHAQSQQQAMELAMSTSAGRSTSASSSTAMPASASTYEYEVASIKPTSSASNNGRFVMAMRYTDDGLSVENFPLMLLLQSAYGVGKERISGIPDWANSERYDIEAKVDGATAEELKKLSPAELKATRQHMLQSLLADRFKLTMHRETKELPVYNLVIAKGGLKLQETKPDDNKPADGAPAGKSSSPATPGTSFNIGGPGGGKAVSVGSGASVSFGGPSGVRSMSGKGSTIEMMLNVLTTAAGRPVIDKTGLTGKYDYKLSYAPEDSQAESDSSAPSLFTAVQEQMGLKLEAGKGPVEIIVIDKVERPSGN